MQLVHLFSPYEYYILVTQAPLILCHMGQHHYCSSLA